MSALEAGQVFGRYTIINAVSAHGSVETYRAYDSTTARDVTLKVFTRQASADPGFSDRFHRGVVALLDLAHPNILDIHDAGEMDGLLYLAMPLVEGETIAQRLAQGTLAAADVDRIIQQTGEAIQFAHARGITDGKLDLDSILLDARGNVVLGDFGVGSLLSGEPLDGARRRDVLLLGAFALALLTGKALAERDAPLAQRLQAWIERLPPSVREAVAARAEAFLAKAVSPQAADRFDSVADFLAAWARLRAESAPAAATVAATAVTPAQQDAARRAAAEAQVQARTSQYERERAERIAAAERSAADARVRVQRETAERDALLRRAVERSALGSSTVIAMDRARHEALSRLLRTINAVAAKRANTVGLPVSFARQPDAVGADRARSVNQNVVTIRPASSARPLPQPRVDLQQESARLQREARARVVTEAQTVSRGIRNVAIVVGIIFFTVFCVLPAACLSLLIAVPDTALGTPVPTVTEVDGAIVVTPLPPPTAVSARATAASPTATARPTITPFVRPSSTPAAPPVTAVLIFTDTFETAACRLPQSDTAQGSGQCADGEYRFLTRGVPLVQTYQLSVGDATIEADARTIVAKPSLEYGIVWRASPEHYFGFTVTPRGDAAVFEFRDGKRDYWIKGLNSSAIGTGSATNRLRVTINRNRLTVAVNGRTLPFEFNNELPSAGQFGFIAISVEAGAQVGFSRLNVWELRPPASPLPPLTPLPTR